mmetsp:Transcript_17669/g.22911  ORF Transcript_17669/g.22911 Transcript_17669/m.22911 type:complete len:215 (-) Transcript_17669:293-937(-)
MGPPKFPMPRGGPPMGPPGPWLGPPKGSIIFRGNPNSGLPPIPSPMGGKPSCLSPSLVSLTSTTDSLLSDFDSELLSTCLDWSPSFSCPTLSDILRCDMFSSSSTVFSYSNMAFISSSPFRSSELMLAVSLRPEAFLFKTFPLAVRVSLKPLVPSGPLACTQFFGNEVVRVIIMREPEPPAVDAAILWASAFAECRDDPEPTISFLKVAKGDSR